MKILADEKPVELKRVWVAWKNTDLTEGRGYEIPHIVCDSFETAIRKGKGENVHGMDCRIIEGIALKLPNSRAWHVPGRIEPETKADSVLREQREIKERQREIKERILDKAKKAGFTDEEIEILKK